jgi:hypothetical protein
VRQEYYYFPRSVHLVTFGKIGTRIHSERAFGVTFCDVILLYVLCVVIGSCCCRSLFTWNWNLGCSCCCGVLFVLFDAAVSSICLILCPFDCTDYDTLCIVVVHPSSSVCLLLLLVLSVFTKNCFKIRLESFFVGFSLRLVL